MNTDDAPPPGEEPAREEESAPDDESALAGELAKAEEMASESWSSPTPRRRLRRSAGAGSVSAGSASAGVAGPDDDDLSVRWAQSARLGQTSTRTRLLGVVAVVVIVALAVVAVLEGLTVHHDDQLASARRSALATAESDAKQIATYTYAGFTGYSKKIESLSTATFADNFKKDSSSLGSILSQYKATSKGSIVGAGVGSVTTSRAKVYVFLDETVANTKSKATTERARMLVTLVRHQGRWLISNAVVE